MMRSVPRVESKFFLNRELSWLEFNARVLHEALDSRNPLLERVKFLGIFSSNLDEFYMVRVAGLRRQIAEDATELTPDGMTPREQLDAIEVRTAELRKLQMSCLHREVIPALAARGIELLSVDELAEDETVEALKYYTDQVAPILTPLAIDPSQEFPHVANLALSLAIELRDSGTGATHVALVEVPKSLPRWVRMGESHRYVPLERLIGTHLGTLFPGFEILRWCPFRITRDAAIDESEDEDDGDPMASLAEHVSLRRFGDVSRLEVQSQVPADMLAMLLDELCDESLSPCAAKPERYVHEAETFLQQGDLIQLASLEIQDLRDPPLAPVTPVVFRNGGRSIFDIVREHDVLVHHPFDSFATTVEEFIDEAASDADVMAIKLTLYRTSGETAIVRALAAAAERGTQVVVVIELKARFDETNNINWARILEDSGAHVVFGVGELKTHAKLALVVRRDEDGIRRYVHVGTGNYNTRTARLYTDIGLLTCDPAIGGDVSDLFNYLTGFSRQTKYNKLLVGPGALRDQLIGLIDREAEHAAAGRPAGILAKMNSVVDPDTIRALYRASTAGVNIELIVRGICCLRPGVPDMSDRIRVVSIVGRFLEHSRVWSFGNGGAEEFYIGSADWMPRSFDRRVEAMVPVSDPALAPRLRSLFATYLADNRQAWDLDSDGAYAQRAPDGDMVSCAHTQLMQHPWGMPLAADIRVRPPEDAAPHATHTNGHGALPSRFNERSWPPQVLHN